MVLQGIGKLSENMGDGDMRYMVHISPYEYGVMNHFISEDIIERSFKSNEENLDMLLAVTYSAFV